MDIAEKKTEHQNGFATATAADDMYTVTRLILQQ